MEPTMSRSTAFDAAQRHTRTAFGQWPAVGLVFFGVAIVYLIGFVDLPKAHNATHDTRHAAGFPCH